MLGMRAMRRGGGPGDFPGGHDRGCGGRQVPAATGAGIVAGRRQQVGCVAKLT
jgi:hypothetical protein